MCYAGWNEKGGTQAQESELKQGTIINISIPNMLTYQQSFSLLPRLNVVFFTIKQASMPKTLFISHLIRSL